MNRKRTLLVGTITAAALLTGSACSNSGTEQPASSSTTSTTAAPTSEAAAAHNQADVKFAHHMIPHHQQAIEMADMILAKPDIDPRVTDLATKIKTEQASEIKQMQDWLAEWGMPTMAMTPGMGMPGMEMTPGMEMPGMGGETPAPSQSEAPGSSPSPSGSMMPGMEGMSGMMGMMSPADMDALNNAQGVEASKLFLTQMIAHHEGAITMAQNEIEKGEFGAAITLAETIATSQKSEIDTMNQILASLG
ncbi:MAG: DUF305 domain-containing protein [Actinomycetia bacterium]|nr:DUF305 domain-containing protein [Actinomycetes bacterium]